MPGMRRREFITLLGGAAAWPLAAHAQQPEQDATIGVLGRGNSVGSQAGSPAFEQRLARAWAGSTAATSRSSIAGRRAHASASPRLRRNCSAQADIIVTSGNRPVGALRQATSVIPIVFVASGDPVGTAWSRVWRYLEATSPACRLQNPELGGK